MSFRHCCCCMASIQSPDRIDTPIRSHSPSPQETRANNQIDASCQRTHASHGPKLTSQPNCDHSRSPSDGTERKLVQSIQEVATSAENKHKQTAMNEMSDNMIEDEPAVAVVEDQEDMQPQGDDANLNQPPADSNIRAVEKTHEPKVHMHKLILTQDDEITAPQSDPAFNEVLKFNLNSDRTFRRFELNRAIWELPQRYEAIAPVGAGSYGLVSSATDTRRQMKVAIKKLARPFQSPIHAKRTYRELTLLAHMKHENVIGLLDVFSPCRSFIEFNDVYLVTHLMGADLGSIIKTQRLSDDHIQFLTYQILRGLKYIHSAGIIHRDLKPSNIAVNEDCELKVLDFGLARHTEAEMTGYVATRWFRAPEIMLNWMRYNQTVDIWSVGCIMAELITSRTLFPGKDHIDQLLRIMTLCGTPDAEFMSKITSEDARNYVRTLPVMKRKNFNEIFAGANPLAIDLLDQMLKLDSDLRPTAEQALAHPYFVQYADPNDEPTATSLYDESFEEKDYTVDDWKRLIWREIVNFKIQNPG